jgi:hypothetical protein
LYDIPTKINKKNPALPERASYRPTVKALAKMYGYDLFLKRSLAIRGGADR